MHFFPIAHFCSVSLYENYFETIPMLYDNFETSSSIQGLYFILEISKMAHLHKKQDSLYRGKKFFRRKTKLNENTAFYKICDRYL